MRISDWSSDVCSSDLPGQGMRRTHHADEIGRHRIGALMQRLEKTVLRTAADTTPDHRPGDISHRAAIDAYRLAEALHHQLLKLIGQEAEALVVGQYRLAAEIGRAHV